MNCRIQNTANPFTAPGMISGQYVSIQPSRAIRMYHGISPTTPGMKMVASTTRHIHREPGACRNRANAKPTSEHNTSTSTVCETAISSELNIDRRIGTTDVSCSQLATSASPGSNGGGNL